MDDRSVEAHPSRGLPIDDQIAAFRDALRQNGALMEVLHHAATLDLPGWYLAGGCLFQTVWNVVTKQPPNAGVRDYDLVYFDDDTSWQAEDAVIQEAKHHFADRAFDIQIRNQARVHLWYRDKFGVACSPLQSTEDAIDTFIATTCCLGVRLEPERPDWRIYAPHGLSDVFDLVVRPNPVLAPPEVYEAKTQRWKHQWPQLNVLPWPRPLATFQH